MQPWCCLPWTIQFPEVFLRETRLTLLRSPSWSHPVKQTSVGADEQNDTLMCLPKDLFNFTHSLRRAQKACLLFLSHFLIIKFIPSLIAIIKKQIIQMKSLPFPFNSLSKGNKVTTMATNHTVFFKKKKNASAKKKKNESLPLRTQKAYRVPMPSWAPVYIISLRLC